AAFANMTRFTEFQDSLGIAPNVLAARLERFVEEGLMTTEPASTGYADYHLTQKGLDFKPAIIALTEWGDRWAAPDGPPIIYEHGGGGGRAGVSVDCDAGGKTPPVEDVSARQTEVLARGLLRRRSPAKKGARSASGASQ